jgi:hypothetical protein
MLSGKQETGMTEPKVEQGGIVWTHEVDRKTFKIVHKRLRRVYTDALAPDRSIPDPVVFERIFRDLAGHPANEAVDGFDVKPWEEKP